MTTTLQSPFANPVTAPQPSVMEQFPLSGTGVPMAMSQLTPGMQAIAAYRARGGRPLGGNGMGALGASMGVQGGGATPQGIAAAQGAQADITGSGARPLPQPTPYGGALQSMSALRPPSGYGTSRPGSVQTMGGQPGTMSSMGVQMQAPPNAGGVRVGRIRPPSRLAYNTTMRY